MNFLIAHEFSLENSRFLRNSLVSSFLPNSWKGAKRNENEAQQAGIGRKELLPTLDAQIKQSFNDPSQHDFEPEMAILDEELQTGLLITTGAKSIVAFKRKTSWPTKTASLEGAPSSASAGETGRLGHSLRQSSTNSPGDSRAVTEILAEALQHSLLKSSPSPKHMVG